MSYDATGKLVSSGSFRDQREAAAAGPGAPRSSAHVYLSLCQTTKLCKVAGLTRGQPARRRQQEQHRRPRRHLLWWAGHHDTAAARRHGQGPVREHCRPLPSPDRSTTTAGKERRDGPTRLTGEPMYHGVKSCQHGLPNQQNHLSNTTQGLFARFHKV